MFSIFARRISNSIFHSPFALKRCEAERQRVALQPSAVLAKNGVCRRQGAQTRGPALVGRRLDALPARGATPLNQEEVDFSLFTALNSSSARLRVASSEGVSPASIPGFAISHDDGRKWS